jgi:hypothetical protein
MLVSRVVALVYILTCGEKGLILPISSSASAVLVFLTITISLGNEETL